MTGFHAASKKPSFSLRVVDVWQAAVLRVRPFVVAADLWARVLSAADRKRLGDALETAYESCGGTAGMWMRLRGVSYARAIVEIGIALNQLDAQTGRWLLREFGDATGEAQIDRESAIAAGALVLSELPREAHWARRRIEIDWGRRSALWAFFWELCRHGKGGQAVDGTAFGEEVAKDYVAKQKSRLVNLEEFPLELVDKIQTSGHGSQILQLPPQEIHLFEATLGGEIREWLP